MKIKIIFPLLFFCFFIFATSCGSPAANHDAETFPDENGIKVVVDQDYFETARTIIREAEQTLHLTQLYMNPDRTTLELVDELAVSARRGVDVQVLLNHEPGSDRNQTAMEILKQAGATVIEGKRSPPGKLHAKMIVADQRIVLMGSTNWSGPSMFRNHETNLRVENEEIANFFVTWIESLMQSPDRNPRLDYVETQQARTVIDRQHETVIRDLLESAQNRIHLGIYGFRTYFDHPRFGDDSLTNDLAEIIRDAHARNIDVKLIVERSDYSEMMNEVNFETAEWFLRNNVPIQFSPLDQTAHWKLLIVDDKAMVSSMNWAFGGFSRYAEASLLVKDDAVVDELYEYFMARWNDERSRPAREVLELKPATR